MRRLGLTGLMIVLRVAAAQMPVPTPAPPMLSPQAAYDRANAPVEVTRRSVENWSDVEKSALNVAVGEAKDACLARSAVTYVGDDLIAYGRLCALGRQWGPVDGAATAYLHSADDAKPQIGLAYALAIQAELNLDREKDAVKMARAMLRAVPYGPLVDEVAASTVQYLQFAYTEDALSLMASRQPLLLRLLAAPRGEAGSVPLHTLYEHALDFPALEQYYNEANVAEILHRDVEQALPGSLPPDEAILIDGARRRYAWLGKLFPTLPGAVSLLSATETPQRQPSYGSATVFFLFPPWCVQCVRLSQLIVPELVRIAVLHGPDYKAPSMYALLADSPPDAPIMKAKKPSTKAAAVTESPKTVVEQLRKTPTLVVSPGVLADFDATDFPFLIATDRDGIIRLMMPAAPDNALVQGGIVDQMTATIIAEWPAKETK